MSKDFDVLIPDIGDRAHNHLPPEDFHLFYDDKLEMSLRFLVFKII